MLVSLLIDVEDFFVRYEAEVEYEDFSIGTYEYWGLFGHQPSILIPICENITIVQNPILDRSQQAIADKYLEDNYEQIQTLLINKFNQEDD
jgi:hypothetical protein